LLEFQPGKPCLTKVQALGEQFKTMVEQKASKYYPAEDEQQLKKVRAEKTDTAL
jgi:hypothetical protein